MAAYQHAREELCVMLVSHTLVGAHEADARVLEGQDGFLEEARPPQHVVAHQHDEQGGDAGDAIFVPHFPHYPTWAIWGRLLGLPA